MKVLDNCCLNMGPRQAYKQTSQAPKKPHHPTDDNGSSSHQTGSPYQSSSEFNTHTQEKEAR